MIDFNCPKCQTLQRVADSAAGQKIACAPCGQRLRVPVSPEMRTMQASLAPPKLSTIKSGKSWFYQQGLTPCGPVTWDELKLLCTAGDLSPEDHVWGEGMAAWKEAQSIPKLFPPRPPQTRRATAPEPSDPGRVFEGLGVLFLGGFIGLAVLAVAGFIVWRGMKQTDQAKAPTSAEQTEKEKDRPLEPTEISDRCGPSVALVRTPTGHGSGFLARPGIVVTNAHVVEGDLSSNLEVTFPSAPGGNTPVKATLLHLDCKRDLAVLRISTSQAPLTLLERMCSKGEKVVVIGSPGSLPGQHVANSVTAGLLSAPTQLDDPDLGGKQDWYLTDAAINHGNSGGPVFDSRGRVIGVATLTFTELGKGGMNYAVPSTDVIKALDKAQARTEAELEELATKQDAIMAFRSYGTASDVYLHSTIYCNSVMVDFVKAGKKAGLGLDAAMSKIGKPTSATARAFTHPDDTSDHVKLTVTDIEEFAELVQKPEDEVREAVLKKVNDPVQRKKIEREIAKVQTIFKPENLQAGAEILKALSAVFQFDKKELYFFRWSPIAWPLGFVLEKYVKK